MRPLIDHADMARDVYMEGVEYEACPYSQDTIAGASWRRGWLEARLNDPLADEAEGIFDEIEAEARAADFAMEISTLKRTVRERLQRAQGMVPDVDAVAVAGEGIPLVRWPKNCFAIATHLAQSGLLDAMVDEFGPYQVCYGGYHGPISPDSVFAQGYAQHGWVEFADEGLVVDPTRWVFTATDPVIACEVLTDYDLAASRFSTSMMGRRPAPPVGDDIMRWDVNDPELTGFVSSLLGRENRLADGVIGVAQAFWLGKQPLQTLGEHAADIYAWFARSGRSVLVPVDNRTYVETTLRLREEHAARAVAPTL